MSESTPIPGEIAERYQVRKLLGRGGFASVYLAFDTHLKRQVAIKIYHPSDEKEAGEMAREAELLAQLQHHNIVRVYDARVIQEEGVPDMPILVMEYLSGGSLREKLHPSAPPMRPQDALGLVAVLAEALQAAHDADILHLDIKPENILFDRQGRPFLTDFGIGRAMGGDNETKQTRAMGTNNYASPEQRQGGTLSPKADIYSLGVVLFELLTNELPLGPAAVNPQPPFSPPFPMGHPLVSAVELARLVCKALAVAPGYRYESAADFAQQLRDYLRQASGDTGRLGAPTGSRQFKAPSVAHVKIRVPDRELRPSELKRVPGVPELEWESSTVLPGTHVRSMIYAHQKLEVGSGSYVEQGAFARGLVRLRQDAVVKGDVTSLTLIDVSPGVEANNLIAPEVMVRGPIRLAGSIFCRRLRAAPSAPGGSDAPIHLPGGSELGGSLIFGEPFGKIVPDDKLGRALKEPRPPIEVFHRPLVRIGPHCTLVAILGDVDVVVEPRQAQLNTIRVQGNVRLGRQNTVRNVQGHDVYIESGCSVDEVYATGKLTISAHSTVGYVRAAQGIELAGDVVISSPIAFSDNGAIEEEGEAIWARPGVGAADLTARHIFEVQKEGRRGGVATVLLDHRLHELYERIAPGWIPALKPAAYEGTGERVRQNAQPKRVAESSSEYSQFDMDLTPASERSEELPGEPGPPDDWFEDEEAAPDDEPLPAPTTYLAPDLADEAPPEGPTPLRGAPRAEETAPDRAQQPTRLMGTRREERRG